MMLLPYITLLCITMPLSSTETTTTIISPTTHISNSTAVSPRYGEIPDITGIKFQYEDSREVGNTIWDNHVEKIIARGILQFALQMDYVLRESDKSHTYDNLVFSPVNIASALAMVMLGSAGKTFEEITTVLGLVSGVDISANSDEVHYHFGKLIRKLQAHPGEAMSTYIAMAGGVFVQEGYPVEVKFLHQIWEIYGSEILSLDFSRHSSEAKDVINIVEPRLSKPREVKLRKNSDHESNKDGGDDDDNK
ncbi:hypothetical protein C0J52_04526 [Blattella germanica]|nr:hypothetical protein C0J52_04526 [Blattella germanica]